MELWVPITLAAAFMQNLRSALQKHLKGGLSTSGATFCRFVYAAPLALAYVALLGEGLGFEWPTPNPRFALFAVLGGVTQITATALLVYLFSLRNFRAGIHVHRLVLLFPKAIHSAGTGRDPACRRGDRHPAARVMPRRVDIHGHRVPRR